MNMMDGTAKAGGGYLYRLGWIVAASAVLLTVWTTIVRNDGSGDGNLMIVLAVAASAFAAGFTAAGLMRAMLGIAVMTVAMGLLMATDPSTPYVDRAISWTGVLTLMWLGSAAMFRAAGRADALSPARP
jgi:hypothetical protein